MRPVIVIATEEERPLVQALLPALSEDRVLLTGVGGTNVIRSLQNVDRKTPVINVGYAGGVGLSIGHVACIGKVRLQHRCDYEEPEFDLGGNVDCYTSCDFIPSVRPGVYDMELAFICALGFQSVKAFKVVSDNIDYEQYKRYINNQRHEKWTETH